MNSNWPRNLCQPISLLGLYLKAPQISNAALLLSPLYSTQGGVTSPKFSGCCSGKESLGMRVEVCLCCFEHNPIVLKSELFIKFINYPHQPIISKKANMLKYLEKDKRLKVAFLPHKEHFNLDFYSQHFNCHLNCFLFQKYKIKHVRKKAQLQNSASILMSSSLRVSWNYFFKTLYYFP